MEEIDTILDEFCKREILTEDGRAFLHEEIRPFYDKFKKGQSHLKKAFSLELIDIIKLKILDLSFGMFADDGILRAVLKKDYKFQIHKNDGEKKEPPNKNGYWLIPFPDRDFSKEKELIHKNRSLRGQHLNKTLNDLWSMDFINSKEKNKVLSEIKTKKIPDESALIKFILELKLSQSSPLLKTVLYDMM